MTPDEADWLDAVASEMERTAGKVDRDKLAAELFGEGGPDLPEYDPDQDAADRLGIPLADYLNYRIDMMVLARFDPWPSVEQVAADAARDPVPVHPCG